MADGLTLFEGPARTVPADAESAQRSLTRRQNELLTIGQHPLSLALSRPLRLHAEAAPYDDRAAPGRRCGNCIFRELKGSYTGKSYPKCTKGDGARITHGSATDCRAFWAACVDHEWKEETDGAGTRHV